MPTIDTIRSREILDSRGNPTIEVQVEAGSIIGIASAPSGASTGKWEAVELRDGGKDYLGKGVKKVMRNVDKIIFPMLAGVDVNSQEEIDNLMIERDGTKNKRKLGANATLAVSLAVCKAGAKAKGMPLYEYINYLANAEVQPSIPKGYFNLINGGAHGDNKIPIQEFLIVPQFSSFKKNLQAASEIYQTLKNRLHKDFWGATNVGDEGGFTPPIVKSQELLKLLSWAIYKAGYTGNVKFALDIAATQLLKGKSYVLEKKRLPSSKMLAFYDNIVKRFPILSIEDPFEENDFENFAKLNKMVNVVGDDLTVSQVDRIKKAIKKKSCSMLLLKLNQVGTLTEGIDAWRVARKGGLQVIVSHRSGETDDSFVADLAVGLGCKYIKGGAPARERVVKYNRLLRIEEIIGG